jgi:hypothetical protein
MSLRFTGKEATTALLDTVLDEAERILEGVTVVSRNDTSS